MLDPDVQLSLEHRMIHIRLLTAPLLSSLATFHRRGHRLISETLMSEGGHY